eukprot:3940728-Rhodomonas_salina.1
MWFLGFDFGVYSICPSSTTAPRTRPHILSTLHVLRHVSHTWDRSDPSETSHSDPPPNESDRALVVQNLSSISVQYRACPRESSAT